ncbi:penicillin acylase family protein [Pseudohalocynthiibacter aestuariivivens]|uniref:Penicillin acylase family protein n=1 Tax=Pseudohalocynthiibacter aestuariivivens TaxID=1591409 RepID=A0ABV5JFZ3_9RHOB|nr:penicillin acylase family protein [Pseudohalocynthiibacter aestuariivivens]MBS9716298.1 penicillin acylase family protein [Pseudohalocynthiibacter aestuariivivens]
MSRLFRWLMRLLGTVLLFAGLSVAVIYYLASRSLPDYNMNYTTRDVSAPVEIVRNNASVPHIFAENDADAFFGLGFVHAQDRLWQMILMRRTAQGRLSELFGERTVPVDELLRRLDLYNLAQQSVLVQDAPTRKALEAYSAGVNAWLARINNDALGRGAPEFFLFSKEIAPWQPADSLALVKLMALQLSPHLEEEVLRARLSLVLSEDRLRDILPDAPGTGVAALPDYAALFPTAVPSNESLRIAENWLSPFKRRAFAGASNAWAAAPERSAAGSTLLANDPHLGFTAPAIWYLARLELSDGGVIGGTIPGIPSVLTGRSDYLGWGVTASYLDDLDVFVEKLNPKNPEEYETPHGFKVFQTSQSVIRVKDGPDIPLTLRWTENGPVLPPSHYDLGSITPPGHVASISWTVLSPNDTTMSSAISLMRAKTVSDGIAAGERFIAPSLNLTLVDGDTIALKTIGAVPSRAARHQSKGRLPSPGWRAVNRWQGRAGYRVNPEFVAPEGGLLGNTNNKLIDRPFPFHISYVWGDTQRVQRWQHLMQNREVHTRDSFIEAQLDTVSFSARALLPLVAADLWFTGEAAADGTTERVRQRALTLLAEWNGEMNEHLPEPLIYAAWMRALQDRLIRDELGPLAQEYNHVEPLFIERVYRDVDGASKWCDVIQSAPIETCADAARQSLDDALLWIEENHGGTLEYLRWGDLHQATQDHEVLGQVPLLSWFVNIRQSTSGGDNTLMRGRTSGSGRNPFLNVHGAGFRGVYDFADPDSSVFVISTGQSGHPLSRHYDDLGELWRRGEYIPMSLDPDLARAAAAGITWLRPER